MIIHKNRTETIAVILLLVLLFASNIRFFNLHESDIELISSLKKQVVELNSQVERLSFKNEVLSIKLDPDMELFSDEGIIPLESYLQDKNDIRYNILWVNDSGCQPCWLKSIPQSLVDSLNSIRNGIILSNTEKSRDLLLLKKQSGLKWAHFVCQEGSMPRFLNSLSSTALLVINNNLQIIEGELFQ